MIITDEIKRRKIELIRLDSERVHYPSHLIRIMIETENIRMDIDDGIWVAEGDVERFLAEMEALDRTRKGEAKLASMGFEEFRLTFQPIDGHGHLSATVYYRKVEAYKDYSYEIKVEIQIDPTSLPRLRVELLGLIQ